jgi:hypothetical protein
VEAERNRAIDQLDAELRPSTSLGEIPPLTSTCFNDASRDQSVMHHPKGVANQRQSPSDGEYNAKISAQLAPLSPCGFRSFVYHLSARFGASFSLPAMSRWRRFFRLYQ